MKRLFALLMVLLLAACAATPPKKGCPGAPNPEPPLCVPAVQETGPEVALLSDIFFSVGPRPGDFDKLLTAALAKYPGSYELHEMAAWWRTVLGDRDGARAHYMRAACDLASPRTDLYLYALNGGLTAGEKRQLLPILAALTERHPDPSLRPVAAAMRADLLMDLGRMGEARRTADTLGYLADWVVLGTFDNDQGKGFYEVYPPEQEVDFSKKYKGKIGEIGWMSVSPLRHDRFLSLKNLLYPDNWSVGYLVTHVQAPAEGDALLSISTGNPTAVWLNGVQGYANDRLDAFFYDTVRIPVRLAKGWNRILVKSAAEQGSWLFAARLTAPDGKPIPGIAYGRDTGGAPLAAPIAQPTSPADTEELLSSPAAQNRQSFLRSLAAQRSGLKKEAKQAMLAFYEGNPDNAVAMYYAAKNFGDNDEEGQLIDLLNRAVGPNGVKTAGFLIQRGDFYRRKQIRESAEDDYRAALALDPRAIGAHWGLAGLYGSRGWQKDRCDILAAMRDRWRDDAEIVRELADCHEARGYFDDAIALNAAALTLEPGRLTFLRRLLSLIRGKQEYPKAIELLNIMVKFAPDDPAYLVEQAELLRRLKRYDEAAVRLDGALGLSPYDPSPYQDLGGMAWERGRREEALAQWKRALDLNPKNSSLSERIAYLTEKEKDLALQYVPTDDEIKARIAVAGQVTPHPGAQALMALDQAVVRVNDDGSSKWYITEVKRVVNDAGRDILINENLPYMGSVKILKAYSLDPNGVRQEASSIRGSQIRFRQLDIGSATVVQYIHYARAPHFLDNQFLGQWYLQTTYYQMLHSELRLIYDPKREMIFDIQGKVEEKSETVENGLVMKTFTVNDRPPLSMEPMSPPVADFLDQLTISSVKSWDEYVNWERALLKNAFVSNKELRSLAAKLTAGETTPRGKLDALFHFVAQEIRYQQDYETTIAGVKPHTPAQIIERGYGDCKDKAVLMIQLAKEVGVKLDYAILRTRGAGLLQKKIPNQQFNHAIVHVPVQPGIEAAYFMDPTVDLLEIGNLRSDDQGVESLVMNIDTAAWAFIPIPYQPAAFNYEKQEISFKVGANGVVTVKAVVTLRGSASSFVRRVLRTQKEAEKLFQGLVNKLFQGGSLLNAESSDIEDIRNPLTLTVEADVSNLLQTQDDKKRLRIPLDILKADLVKLTTRTLPMELGIKGIMSSAVTVELPTKAKVEFYPKGFKTVGSCFTVERGTKADKNMVNLLTVYTKECTVIDPADYPAFRTAVQDVVSRQEDYIIFK